jgi:hypothetical protein
MKTINTFEEKLASQVNLNKAGIYEAFVNQGELREYLGLEGERKSPMMQKVFVPVFGGEILSISFERSRAIRNILDEAGVDTLEELENTNN